MRAATRLIALIALGAAGTTGGLSAQVLGLPVRNAGVGTGISLAADVGIPNTAYGKGVAFGATGAIGLGPLGITGSVATWNPKGAGGSITSVGVTGNLKVFGGPLIPVSVTLQAGAGHSTEAGETTWHVPVGLGLALTIPNPAFSIKPWLAPRIDINKSPSNGVTPDRSAGGSTEAKFGISGGVDFGFLSGLAVRVMYDRVSAGNGFKPSVLSLGLGFKVGT